MKSYFFYNKKKESCPGRIIDDDQTCINDDWFNCDSTAYFFNDRPVKFSKCCPTRCPADPYTGNIINKKKKI